MSDWQRWQRPGPDATQRRNDGWTALAVAAGGVAAVVFTNSMGVLAFGTAPTLAEQLAWALALAAPLAVRRRFPTAAALAVAALFIAAQARRIGDNVAPSVALFISLYTLGAWGRDRVVARWVRIGVIAVMFGWLGIGLYQAIQTPAPVFDGATGPLPAPLAAALYSIGFNLVFFLGAYFFGEAAWESARRRHELQLQQEELRRSQAENARQAVVAERVRIARDLHDVVAHHVSVMGVQAAAARRVFDSDPEVARSAISTVESTARTAIGELRGLLGVLRANETAPGSEADGAHPSPGLAELPQLVEKTRATGLAATYSVHGPARPVPTAVALSAYRVVQEALTNTVRHAHAQHVDVRVRFLEAALEVDVSDDGLGPTPGPAKPDGGGLGLVGMRERVAVHGGELEVGPRRDGGFQVRARFPLADAASAAADAAVS